VREVKWGGIQQNKKARMTNQNGERRIKVLPFLIHHYKSVRRGRKEKRKVLGGDPPRRAEKKGGGKYIYPGWGPKKGERDQLMEALPNSIRKWKK